MHYIHLTKEEKRATWFDKACAKQNLHTYIHTYIHTYDIHIEKKTQKSRVNRPVTCETKHTCDLHTHLQETQNSKVIQQIVR